MPVHGTWDRLDLLLPVSDESIALVRALHPAGSCEMVAIERRALLDGAVQERSPRRH